MDLKPKLKTFQQITIIKQIRVKLQEHLKLIELQGPGPLFQFVTLQNPHQTFAGTFWCIPLHRPRDRVQHYIMGIHAWNCRLFCYRCYGNWTPNKSGGIQIPGPLRGGSQFPYLSSAYPGRCSGQHAHYGTAQPDWIWKMVKVAFTKPDAVDCTAASDWEKLSSWIFIHPE